ncbi:MAG: hypothetical protein IT379_23505 [Deltaproteobacteria bacterium]|nr:hypothetical protein [Deltaproteobacteria bacterium]
MRDEDEPHARPVPPVEERSSSDADALVRKRRFWRRVKAASALVLGVGAGTFLACYSAVTRAPVRTVRPDTPSEANEDAGTPDGSVRSLDAGPPMDASAGAAPRFPPWPTSTPDGSTGVDVDEHRRGMPVPDNLLE